MKKIRIFFLSTALSDDIYLRITADCKSFKPTFSGVGFDRNVAEGLSQYADVMGISLYPLPSYPKYRYIWKSQERFCTGAFSCKAPAMCNLPILKEFVYCYDAVRTIKKSLCSNEQAVIVLCGLYRSLLRPAAILKKRYGIPVCAIVPDLPELMVTYRNDYSKLRQWLNQRDIENAKKYRDCVDGYVFLSKFMGERVNTLGKPSVIVDGLCRIATMSEGKKSTTENYILYAGKITEKFGVDKLVEGFLMCDIPQMKLYLCGDGDYAQRLQQISQSDDRVQFLGLVPHETVLSLEAGATLLVDPRPTDNEIVKMSFPSKIIEYMASGTPVLTTNLPCFSKEYDIYQYRIEEETPEGIKRALETVFSLTSQEREAMGKEARRFVVENKTLETQCKKIISLLEEVVQKNEHR